ncbi:MAG: ABC transporter substrate-binding protein [Bacillota bacterium]|nr:ABC transporter substrate-binding protein [Bacillota bacterium]
MKRRILALVLISVLLFTVILTGCGSSGSSSTGGQTFVFAQGSDPRGLDPAYVDDGESSKVIVNVYEGLLQYKSGSTEVEPCLATSWTVSPDGKEYTFKLRQGVKFQDGTPFNADAVVYSVGRQLPPNRTDDMPYASFTFGPVTKVEKIDDYTVKFTLNAPYTPFLANLAMSLAAPIVSPTAAKAHNGNLNENPVGTGPFKFVKWDKGQSITLERNDNYWGAKPKLAKVVFQFIKENSVRASQLATGAIDAMDGLDPNDVKMLQDKNMQIFKDNGMNINYMAFNCSRPPFNDPKLREAVSHAINTDELVKYLYQGYSELANSPLPSFMPGYDKDLKPYAYDPEKSKQMLKDLGKENLNIKIITYSNPRPYNSVNGQKLAEAVQGYLAKVGITATIVPYEWAEYKTKAGQGEGDIMFYGWIGDNGDPDNFLSLLESKEIQTTLNTAKYANPVVDQLLEKARTLPNGDERNKTYQQIQQITGQDAAWLPISHALNMAAYAPNVKEFAVHPTGNIFFKNVTK